jgi:putative ABC transport system substrate-binding protein
MVVLFYLITILLITGFAQVQYATKTPRLGLLFGVSASHPYVSAFQQGLRELGYVEGQNIIIEYRYAEGETDRFPGLAAELVQLNVDIIVTAGAPPTRAAQHATSTIPIVMTQVGSPARFVNSLARPGGNITGLTTITKELEGKRLELLKEVVPKLSRVAVLWNPIAAALFNETKMVAQSLALQLQSLEVTGPEDFERAFRAATRERSQAVITLRSPLIVNERHRIAELAIKSRLAAIYDDRDFVEAGGLMSYGTNIADLYRRAAIYVDKILKGAKPADLPIEQPTKFELLINLKTAKQIGLTIPPNVLAKADRVIK